MLSGNGYINISVFVPRSLRYLVEAEALLRLRVNHKVDLEDREEARQLLLRDHELLALAAEMVVEMPVALGDLVTAVLGSRACRSPSLGPLVQSVVVTNHCSRMLRSN